MATVRVGKIAVDGEQIRLFCEKWQIAELALFGSVLREDFRPDSDVDVLVTFKPGDSWRFGDLLKMQDELACIFGRNVDLVEREAVEQNPNWLTRRGILASASVLHAA